MVGVWLIIAGLFETFWAILTILGMVASFAGLIIATKRLPIGIKATSGH